jgi:hypothetical protein
MSYYKDENKNPLDYYGLRQPAIKQVIIFTYLSNSCHLIITSLNQPETFQ